jgi:hypothetical protein
MLFMYLIFTVWGWKLGCGWVSYLRSPFRSVACVIERLNDFAFCVDSRPVQKGQLVRRAVGRLSIYLRSAGLVHVPPIKSAGAEDGGYFLFAKK